jgi:hypothetical protein
MKVDLLLQGLREKNKQDSNPWWNIGGEPTREEITRAIGDGHFIKDCNDKDPHLGNRDWHIGRVAGLIKYREQREYPIEVSNGKLLDGGHRLLAYNYLGIEEIDTF